LSRACSTILFDWPRSRGAAATVTLYGSCKRLKLAQLLGQLQLFTAVFPQECAGQLASFGPT
jgi:hypothetical protein